MLLVSRLRRIAFIVILLGVVTACGAREEKPPQLHALRVGPDGLEIAAGVRLVPGSDGSLPVIVRWINDSVAPDGLAVDGRVGYVFGGDSLDAFDIEDGETIWSATPADDRGFESSGDVRIGTDGSGHVEVWAPYEMSLVVDRETGRVLRRGPGFRHEEEGTDAAEPPAEFSMFTQQQYDPATGTVHLDDTEFVDEANRLVARNRDGTTLWSIEIEAPMFENLGPVAVPGGMIISLANEKVLRLDYRQGGS